jgi:flagellar motor switch protein FliG
MADLFDMTPRHKVAILMIALGQETAAQILKYLNDYEIEEITQAIAELKTVTTEQEDEVLQEFEQLLAAGHAISRGGIEFARGALEKAFGSKRTQSLLDRVNSTTSNGFYMLRNIAPNQIAPFISKEHPQTIALILSQLEPGQAAGVIAMLPEKLQSDVTYRIATLDNISPQVLKQIEESLAEELHTVLNGQVAEIGGPKRVAEILNMTGRSTERAILERLDGQDPEIAENIRNMMFTFDDIVRLTDREIQLVLREVDTKDLAVALKGSGPDIQERVFDNVSERVREMIKEEMEFMGPVRLSDVEEVQLRIVQTVRQLEEAGQVTVIRGEAQDVYV